MKIQTISLCAGEGHCGRNCPYCVSAMTGKTEFSAMPNELSPKVGKALRLAQMSGVSTALITGKGEPLLTEKSRGHVMQYLSELRDLGFPFIEIQTSGHGLTDETLGSFKEFGVTTVAISCVSVSLTKNQDIYGRGYEDPFVVAERVHRYDIMVRLCCTMCAGYCESPESMGELIQACRLHEIEQMSFAPVRAPHSSKNGGAAAWVKEHEISDRQLRYMYNAIRRQGTPIMSLVHGGMVYDVGGVSVCLRDCLTESVDLDDVRQLIVYPNGETRYSWTLDAARFIRGDRA